MMRPSLCWSGSFLTRGTTDEFYRFFKLVRYFHWMVETRIAFRHRVLKTATIEFGGDAIDCVVRNLSSTGAALEVSSQFGIPATFTLVVPGDSLHLPCAVVWRTPYRIGVHFDQGC
jgi:hypothetical protein